MRTRRKGAWLTKAVLLCGTATLMLAAAPVDFTTFDLSTAFAAGGERHGAGNGNGAAGGRGESRSEDKSPGRSDDSRGSDRGSDRGGDDARRGSQATTVTPQAGRDGDGGTSGGTISAWTPPSGGKAGGASTPDKAKRAGKPVVTQSDEDSDRPAWAGVPGGRDGAGGGAPDMAGSTRGDLYGDLFVIARDDQGVPILTPEGWVQPLDIYGNLIPLDDEGYPVDESLAIEVELGRLNVGRAPASVLLRRADEVVGVLESATDLTTDAAGRLVLTVDGVQQTIDSPLENLAIYVALMTTGTIAGVDDLPGDAFDFMVDGTFTTEDLAASTAFLAAATDKSGEFTTDEVAYINAFLGIATETVDKVTYSVIDYSDFTYDRAAAYADVYADVLVFDDGVWVPTTVNIYDVVFDATPADTGGTLEAYTTAADDARTVINFLHEYEVPAEDLATVTH